MNPHCIFCRIVAGTQPSDIVYQDDQVTAFRDIEPQASTHILVIPNQHIVSLAETEEVDPALLGHLLQVAARLAQQEGIDASGYRVVTNVGQHAGQTVHHLHFHLLGGNRLHLPLG